MAGGKAGVFRTRNGGSTWQQLGGSAIPTNGPFWESIAGYHACGRDVVYAGAKSAAGNSIVRSIDDGATWGSVTSDPTLIHPTIGGPGGQTWWLGGRFSPGTAGYVASSLLTGNGSPGGPDCLDPDVWVAGRSGIVSPRWLLSSGMALFRSVG